MNSPIVTSVSEDKEEEDTESVPEEVVKKAEVQNTKTKQKRKKKNCELRYLITLTTYTRK